MWEYLRRLRKGNSTFFLTLTGIFLAILLVATSACGGESKEPSPQPVSETGAKPVDTPVVKDVPASGNIAHISDIHFNPFYDSTLVSQLIKADVEEWESIFATSKIKGFGTYYKNETNYHLLKFSLENMAAVYKTPDFIIFTGDFIAHEFHDKYKANNNGSLGGLDPFIQKTVTFMVLMFRKYFPNVPVYVSLGNNDSYTGDYKIVPGGAFLKDTSPILSGNWLKTPANKTSFAATYPIGGYYTVVPPETQNTRIISLNTILFSPKHTTTGPNDAAAKQLEWFESQLKAAKEKNEKVWLLLHIPPGTNVYSTIHKKEYKSFWQPPYNDKFIQLLTTYSSILKAGYAGHTHMDDFRLVFDRDRKPIQAIAFVRICPAVSPQFGNNPAFQHLTYDPAAFSLINYEVYYLDVGLPDPSKWEKEYDFNKTYGQPAVNPAALQAVYYAIKDNQQTRTYYMNYYDVNHRVSLNDQSWKTYWCGIGNLQERDFGKCNASVME